MKKALYIGMILLLLASCGGKKEIVTSLEQQMIEAPSWVTSRPISSFEYVGIGKAAKRGDASEYQAIARRNALNDMASEIEVTVTSNSLLHTLERNDMLTESFSESIITRSNLKLEGFEVTDDYQNEEYYWVFYRLDKGLYNQIKAERKQQAMERSYQLLESARIALSSGDVVAAAGQYVQTIQELQPYWGEVNTYEGVKIDALAFEELMKLNSDLHLESDLSSIHLSESNGFLERLTIRSMVGDIPTVPLEMEYRFDQSKKIKLTVDRLQLDITPQGMTKSILSVSTDPFEQLRREVRRSGMGFLEEVLRPRILLVDIRTVYPKVSIETSFIMPDSTIETAPELGSSLIASLADIGIIVDNTGSSPYVIRAIGQMRNGGMSMNFHVAYTDLELSAGVQEEIRYSTRLESIKGVHNSLENALLKSKVSSAERIDDELVKQLINKLF